MARGEMAGTVHHEGVRKRCFFGFTGPLDWLVAMLTIVGCGFESTVLHSDCYPFTLIRASVPASSSQALITSESKIDCMILLSCHSMST